MMKKQKMLLAGVALSAAVAIGAGIQHSSAQMTAPASGYASGVVSGNGDIQVPENFRTEYLMIGVWSVAGDADTGGGVGFHVVYTQPEAAAAFKESGKFPDGAVLVKELFKGKTEDLTTGKASSVKEQAGYFVMVKDEKGRFSDNKLWGDGWGWSFFNPGETKKTVSTDYKADCLGCHEPVRNADLVYSYAYPLLQK